MLRKLADSEFCSDGHRRSYQKEQEQLALSRLAGSPARNEGRAAEAKLKDSEVRGFLDQQPQAKGLKGVRRIELQEIRPEHREMMPEFGVKVEAGPGLVGGMEEDLAMDGGMGGVVRAVGMEPAMWGGVGAVRMPAGAGAVVGDGATPGLQGLEGMGEECAAVDSVATGWGVEAEPLGMGVGDGSAVAPVLVDYRLPEMGQGAVVAMEGEPVAGLTGVCGTAGWGWRHSGWRRS